VACPICEKRKPERFCLAKGEKICAVCCGREREVTIDCPADCAYLVAAHRYEDEHRKALSPDTPLLDVSFSSDIIYSRQQELAGIAFTIATVCSAHPAASDPDVLAALAALAETYRTLGTGIYYEKPPDAPAPRALYGALAKSLGEIKQHSAEHSGFATIKDSEILALLLFLYRMELLRNNGRPRSRKFIEFLRAQFPKPEEVAREESRIIVP
jgi:hypothetical protein